MGSQGGSSYVWENIHINYMDRQYALKAQMYKKTGTFIHKKPFCDLNLRHI